jgi:hypothetical protein
VSFEGDRQRDVGKRIRWRRQGRNSAPKRLFTSRSAASGAEVLLMVKVAGGV